MGRCCPGCAVSEVQGTVAPRGVGETGVPAGLEAALSASPEPAASPPAATSWTSSASASAPGHSRPRPPPPPQAACLFRETPASLGQVCLGGTVRDKHQQDPPEEAPQDLLWPPPPGGVEAEPETQRRWAAGQTTQPIRGARAQPVFPHSRLTPHSLGDPAPSQHLPCPAQPCSCPLCPALRGVG